MTAGKLDCTTNATETITDSYEYDEFGILSNVEGSTPNPFKYVGRFGIMSEGMDCNT